MSSYGSMSPSDEGFDRYEPQYYCQPHGHQGSPMESGMFWPSTTPDPHEYESQDMYHDNPHYIGRNYGYDDIQITTNDPYDYHQTIHGNYAQPNMSVDCTIQSGIPIRAYDRPTIPTFGRVVKRRTTANKKERRRTQSINTAFSDLRECIPNVPADTKLSKIKTLRLATSYISYLMKVLETDGEPAGGFRAELHSTPPRRQRNADSNTQQNCLSQSPDKRCKGRTGWPQHVWALELKNEQNLQT